MGLRPSLTPRALARAAFVGARADQVTLELCQPGPPRRKAASSVWWPWCRAGDDADDEAGGAAAIGWKDYQMKGMRRQRTRRA